MKHSRGIFLLIFFLGASVWNPLCAQDTIFYSRSGITIHLRKENKMFPANWYKGKINAKAKSLPKDEVERTVRAVRTALDKYGSEFLRRHVTDVYLLGRMGFFREKYSGTYSGKKIYISSAGGLRNGVREEFIEGTFHHEFSSVIYYTHKDFFPEGSWKLANDPAFYYGSGSISALKSGKTSLQFDSLYMTSGILCEYGSSSLEEDLNTYAEGLFEGKLNEQVDSFPRVKLKTGLLKQFYMDLDPTLDETDFSRFCDEEKKRVEARDHWYQSTPFNFKKASFYFDKSEQRYYIDVKGERNPLDEGWDGDMMFFYCEWTDTYYYIPYTEERVEYFEFNRQKRKWVKGK